MDQDFSSALDELISRYKPTTDLDTMIADMSGAIAGLQEELARIHRENGEDDLE